MAELSVPYAQRKFARPSAGGGGGGGLRAVGQPSVPDVSKMYAPLQTIGAEFEDITSELGRVAAQRQKARDVATLTEFESGINEALGVKAEDIKADQRIHPDDYYETMVAERQKILDARLPDMPGRLQGIAKSKAIGGTERLMIGLKAEGEKRALERYTNAYDLFMDQQERYYLNTNDPRERQAVGEKMREKTVEYLQAGTFSPDQAAIKLREARDKIEYAGLESYAIHQPEAFLHEEASGLLQDLPGDKRTKLIDKARSVQREQFHFAEAQEAKLERDTAKRQADNEAVAFGNAQKGRLSRAQLDALRDQREIGPKGYETVVRYLDTKAREDRSEARAAESLNIQRQERRNRETDAQLSIMASTGQLDQAGILEYARAHKLPASAMDGAIMKSNAREQMLKGEYRSQQNQAEQLLSKGFPQTIFDKLDAVSAQAYADALDELTRRSKAFGGQEDPIAVAQEILPKYQASISQDTTVKSQGIQELLRYPEPALLEADKANIPATMYEQQRKLFKQAEDLMKRQQTLAPEPKKKPTWSEWWYGPQRTKPTETPP